MCIRDRYRPAPADPERPGPPEDRRPGEAGPHPQVGGPAAVGRQHRRRRQAGRHQERGRGEAGGHPAGRGHPPGDHPRSRGPRPGHRHGLQGDPRRRSRSDPGLHPAAGYAQQVRSQRQFEDPGALRVYGVARRGSGAAGRARRGARGGGSGDSAEELERATQPSGRRRKAGARPAPTYPQRPLAAVRRPAWVAVRCAAVRVGV